MKRWKMGLRLVAAGTLLASASQGAEPGLVVSWGLNSSGQLTVPPPNEDFILLAAGAQHSLGLKSDSSLVAWGLNGHGQLYIPSPNSGWMAMDAGTQHSAGIRNDGRIEAWGDNNSGQCTVPEPNEHFVQVSAGATFTLGLKADGTLVAWGANDIGQLNIPAPNSGFTHIASGPYHSLALREDGSLAGWGANQSGQSNAPSPNGPFVDMACGLNHSLALRPDGSIVAWGLNTAGQCNVPAPNTGYVAVAAGMFHSLALRADGSLIAWGNNIYGQSEEPQPDAQFMSVNANGWHNLALQRMPSCALSTDSLDFGQVQPDVAVTRTLTVTNTGGGVLTGSLSSACEAFTLEGEASYSLAAGQSQPFTLRFLGGEPGAYACELSTGCTAVSLSGVAEAWPACSLSADSLDFGQVQPDVAVTRTLTVSNTGGGVLTGSLSSACEAFTLVGEASYSLAAGQSQPFTLRFLGGTPGSYACELSTGCTAVSLSGVAEAWPACSLSADSLDFGQVQPDVAVTRTLTVTNTGGGVLTGSLSSPCEAFTLEGEASYSLVAGQSQSFTLRFLGGTPGSYTCELSTGCTAVSLSGVAEAWPACSLSADSLDFGQVQPDVAVTRTLTVSNTGGGVLTGSLSSACEAFSLEGEASYSLAAGQSQPFTLRFLGGTPGSYTCELSTGCTAVNLSGVIELRPFCLMEPDTLRFDTQLPGSVASASFTVHNGGGGLLTGTFGPLSEPFALEGDGQFMLTAGASQTFTVHVQGSEAGNFLSLLRPVLGQDSLRLEATLVGVELVTGPGSACGLVEDLGHMEGATTGFMVDWIGGAVGVNLFPAPGDNMSITLLANGEALWNGPALAQWRSDGISLDSLLGEDVVLHLVVEDGLGAWNNQGEHCAWDLAFASAAELLPTAFLLHEAAPNPFNPSTRLRLDLPLPGFVTVRAFDLLGRRVDNLLERPLPAGRHDLRWEPRGLASGTYFLVAESSQGVQVRKVLLLK